MEVLVFLFLGKPAFDLGDGECEQEECYELGGEGFGGSDTNLDSGTGDVGECAFPDHGAGGDIADGEGVRHAEFLGMPQCRQGVCGFHALADGDDEFVFVWNAVPVAVFAGDLDFNGDPGDGFYPVFCGGIGIVAGAAGEDEDGFDVAEDVPRLFAE